MTTVDQTPLGISAPAQRCAEIINQAVVDGHGRRWVAIRLSDGGSDGVIYDTRADAIRHQLHETQCVYVSVPMDGMSTAAAQRYLEINRQLYAAGARLADPEHEVIMPTRVEQLPPSMRGRIR